MESLKHNTLVNKIIEYISNFEEIEPCLIESDTFGTNGKITRMPEGYIPDVYYKYKNTLIIGEAKTDNDFERIHSIQQYTSYLRYLKRYEENYKCILIIAVPWETTKTACRIIYKLSRENNNLNLIIMNEMGEYKKYEKNYSTQ